MSTLNIKINRFNVEKTKFNPLIRYTILLKYSSLAFNSNKLIHCNLLTIESCDLILIDKYSIRMHEKYHEFVLKNVCYIYKYEKPYMSYSRYNINHNIKHGEWYNDEEKKNYYNLYNNSFLDLNEISKIFVFAHPRLLSSINLLINSYL